MVLVFTISAKAVLDPLPPLDCELLVDPRPPAVVEPPAELEPLLDEDEDDAELDPELVEPADTASPAVRLASETIVPLVGA